MSPRQLHDRVCRLNPHRAAAWLVLTVLAGVVGFTGCTTTEDPPPTGPTPVTYTGPDFLRGTVRSAARIRGYEPKLVSGFGLVVGLEDGTGSSEIPAYLREHMINEMRKLGVGSSRIANNPWENMSPEQVLRNKHTAIVAVFGLVPPGAIDNTRFDVLVQALPQTQTTSLAGGRLFTTELSENGIDPNMRYSPTVAKARGPIYMDPFKANTPATQPGDEGAELQREAVVVAGGWATRRRRIDLVLNAADWTGSRDMADRINERFPAEPHERVQTARAQTPQLIRLEVPRRFATNPNRLIDLIAHLYTQRGERFEPTKARELVQVLENQPEHTRSVVQALRALGRTTLEVLREHYDHSDLNVRLAVLEAGAALNDKRAGVDLAALAEHRDPEIRTRVAEALAHLPQSNRGNTALRNLLGDSDRDVRIGAYETLAMIDNRGLIDRMHIRSDGDLKFIIHRVPSDRPMIYVTHEHVPRIVVFGNEGVLRGPDIPLKRPMFVPMWDSRLTIQSVTLKVNKQNGAARMDGEIAANGEAQDRGLSRNASKNNKDSKGNYEIIRVGQPRDTQSDTESEGDAEYHEMAELYYQAPGQIEGQTRLIEPTVTGLAYAMGHRASMNDPQKGLDLSYSQIVNALYLLCENGHLDVPIEVKQSVLAQAVEQYRQQVSPERRPETGAPAQPGPAGQAQSDAAASEGSASDPRPGTSAPPAGQTGQTGMGLGDVPTTDTGSAEDAQDAPGNGRSTTDAP